MQAWQNFLSHLRQELGDDAIERWLTPLKVDRFDACNLYLKAQNAFQVGWFEEHIRPKIKKKFVNNNHHFIKVHLSLDKEKRERPESDPYGGCAKGKEPSSFLPDPIDATATLDSFLPTPANQVAFALLQELAEEKLPLGTFNPIFLHGEAATGKTHLLMGVATALQKLGKKVFYVRAETFTAHVVKAIRSGVMIEFRNTYRHVDLLIVDSIQVLARRGATQEELFHTFNALHMIGKQLIISANSPAGLLAEIEPRLISRFEWGISLRLEKLSREQLGNLLNSRCDALDFPLMEDVQFYLLKQFGSSPRALLSALDALVLFVHMRRVRSSLHLSLEDTKEAVHSLLESEERGALIPQKIISVVAEYYGISPEEIVGKSQTQSCATPRQVAMHLCRDRLKVPYLQLGKIFHRDHSTVMSSIKLIQKRLAAQDRELTAALSILQQKLCT
jgi:chromosomal replication initiator protein